MDLSSPLAQLETDSGIQLLAQLHHIVRETPQITTAGLIERFREDERRPALEKLATRDHLLGEDKVKTFFSETMATLEVQALAASIEELLSQSSEKDLTEADKTRLAELYRRREELRSGASNS
jgi:DNA primase